MSGIKRILNEHTENNIPKYIAATAVFAAGFVLGIAGSFGSGNGTVENVAQSIRTTCESVSAGGVDAPKLFWISVWKNLRNCLAIFLGGFSLWLSPLIPGLLFACGFSYGYTAGFLSANFGSDGFLLVLVSSATAIVIVIPVYAVLSVISFNNSLKRRRLSNGSKNTAVFAAVFVLVSLLLIPAAAIDAFVVPEIVKQICVRIVS